MCESEHSYVSNCSEPLKVMFNGPEVSFAGVRWLTGWAPGRVWRLYQRLLPRSCSGPNGWAKREWGKGKEEGVNTKEDINTVKKMTAAVNNWI